MKCNQVLALLDEYLHGSLTQEQTKILENHLNDCEACRQSVEAYRFFLTDARIEDDFSPPKDLNVKIKYTISQAKKEEKIPFWRRKQVLAYATALCFLCVAGLWGNAHFAKLKHDVNVPVTVVETADTGSSMQAEQTAQEVKPPVAQPTVTPETNQTVPLKEPSVTNDLAKAEPTPKSKPKMQPEIASAPKEETSVVSEPVSEPIAESEAVLQDKAEMVSEPESLPQIASENVAEQVPALDLQGGGGGSSGGGSAGLSNEEEGKLMRNLPQTTSESSPEADVRISKEFQEQILGKYAYTQLFYNTYLVEITKSELEREISVQLTVSDEAKTPLTIQFIVSEE